MPSTNCCGCWFRGGSQTSIQPLVGSREFAERANKRARNPHGRDSTWRLAHRIGQLPAGRLAAVCGDNEAADRLFTDAARRDERAGAPALVSRDLRYHAQFLHADGHPCRADQLLLLAAENTG